MASALGNLVVAFWLQLAAPPAVGMDAQEVASRIQKFYDSTKDFQAAFQQEYYSPALGQKKTSSGFVYIKKPGMMRWDYAKPRPKHFVADGTALYIYDPDLDQVMVDRSFSGSDLSTAVSFLWGKGNLSEEFILSFATRADIGGPQHYTLEMKPKKDARFKRLFFVVSKESFQVVETVVEDPGGNVNHVFFANVSTNVGLKDESFRFVIPEGVEVIEAPREPRGTEQ